jgi:hypothetical protein
MRETVYERKLVRAIGHDVRKRINTIKPYMFVSLEPSQRQSMIYSHLKTRQAIEQAPCG